MSKNMKVTKCWTVELPCGGPNDVLTQPVNGGRIGNRPAALAWASDFAKLRRAWRLVEKLADTATDGVAAANRKDTLIFEARRIVGKK